MASIARSGVSRTATACALVLLLAVGSLVGQESASGVFSRLPLAFVENAGQWETPARFVARRAELTARLEERAIVLQLERGHEEAVEGLVVRLGFDEASSAACVVGEGRQPGLRNFLLGNDPARWRVRVPAYDAIAYRGLWPGIDLRVREGAARIEYDLLVSPGSDLSRARFRADGIERLTVDEAGSLVLHTVRGPIRQTIPSTWEVAPNGETRALLARHRLLGDRSFGFEVAGRDPALPLVVDPGFEWATFLGGSLDERAWACAVEPTGGIAVVGESASLDFPASAGAYDTTFNGGGLRPNDAWVALLNGTGSALVYCTYLGGADNDSAGAVGFGRLGTVIVGGTTESSGFPTTPGAYDTSYNGGGGSPFFGGDLFVAHLGPTGSSLVFSTVIGGNDLEYVSAMAVDAFGETTLAGHVHSLNFPITPGAFDSTHNLGGGDAYVTRLNASGTGLVFSTFLGGAAEEYVYGMALDPSGDTIFGGATDSPGFPTTVGAYDTTYAGGGLYHGDALVARIDPTGGTLVYSTFLGGAGGVETIYGLARDTTGIVTIAGETQSFDYPTTPGAFDSTLGGTQDAILAKLSANGNALLGSTFFGGTGADLATMMAQDSAGRPVIVGGTQSADFPTTPGAFVTTATGLFASRFSAGIGILVYSTTVPGAYPTGVALDVEGAATMAGVAGFPLPVTPGAYDTTYNGGLSFGGDAFAGTLDLLPAGVSKYGWGSSGCTPPPTIGVTSMPSVGNAGFAVLCVGLPPLSIGIFGLSSAGLATPIQINNVAVWLHPAAPLVVALPAASFPNGEAIVPLPIPPDPAAAGFAAFVQFFWPDACAPVGFFASNPLALVVQP